MAILTLIKKRNELEKIYSVVNEVKKVIVGQDDLIWKVIIALLADGHVLLEGVPGLAKTLLVSALSRAFNGCFKRVQMMPDMMPSDILGTYIYVNGDFEVEKGPIIDANFVLVDEINRASAKTQAALLEAMQERQVTILAKETFKLKDPFMVLATQNPIEQEGIYPLPEAQLDRFLLKLLVDYPALEDEVMILSNENLDRRDRLQSIEVVMSPDDIVDLKTKIKEEVFLEEEANRYIVDLCRATRFPEQYGLDALAGRIRMGASPRGVLGLRDAARVRAFLNGRSYVYPGDIVEVAPDVLRHRIVLDYTAEMDGLTCDDVIRLVVDGVKVP